MKNKGFTLVEMMAVLVILSLLIGIGIYTVNNIKRGAADNYYVSM
ncbi:MAG: type II secretion system protein, partial [Bacilli bacterium]|nr:type II secretion system protein [Bacilli bacterium]